MPGIGCSVIESIGFVGSDRSNEFFRVSLSGFFGASLLSGSPVLFRRAVKSNEIYSFEISVIRSKILDV